MKILMAASEMAPFARTGEFADEMLESPLVARLDRKHESDVIVRRISVWVCAFDHLREEKADLTTGSRERLAKFLSPCGAASVFFVDP